MAQERYTQCEISLATGIAKSTVCYRVKKLGIVDCNGIVYEDIQKIINFKKRLPTNPRKVDKLKLQLKNDGYQIGK